jgi:alkanesulfonate monooxygenase SsuD/methylene tetrahydromethanopterin reductase-like flavin-dependent oxidoreductase (luciferase family)
MSHELRFQVEILPDLEWPALLERFQHVEALGFDLVGTGDQFVDSMNPSKPWFDLWALLAGVAQATHRIRIAPCVAQIPMRDPATLARQVLTVDHISNGRVEVGLGLGRPVAPSYRMMGIPNWDNSERADRFREYVEIVDRMLTNEQTTYEGRHYRVEGATVHRSVQSPRPPITIAAMGPRMMHYAATYADTWNTMSFATEFEDQLVESADRVSRMAGYCESVGRDPETLRHSYLMFDANARQSGGHFSYYDSPQAFANMADRLLDLGFTELGLYYPALPSQRPVFETIANDVIPALRESRKPSK